MGLKKFTRKRIGEILIEEGHLEPHDLQKALEIQKQQGGLVGEILVQQGWVTEEQLMTGLSKQLSLPFIELSNYNVSRSALGAIPKEVAERYLCFPFDQDEQEIFVAMGDPSNEEAIEEVRKRVPLSVQFFLAAPSEIRKTIKVFYGDSDGG